MQSTSETQLGQDLSKEVAELVQSFAYELHGPLFAQGAAGLSPREQEALYTQAYGCYRRGAYLEAMSLFVILMREDMSSARYAKGMAACYQKRGVHDKAAAFYGWAYFLNVSDPSPICHIAQCLLAKGETKEAAEAFETFIEQADASGSSVALRDYASSVLSHLAAH